MASLFSRAEVTKDDQDRLGRLGAFDWAVNRLRDTVVGSDDGGEHWPFTVELVRSELTREDPRG